MKELSNDKKFEFLESYALFTHEELILVIKGWGDNEKTYDTICYVRYCMDFEQLREDCLKVDW